MKHLLLLRVVESFATWQKHLGTKPIDLKGFANGHERLPRKNEGKSDDTLRDTLTHQDILLRDRVVKSIVKWRLPNCV